MADRHGLSIYLPDGNVGLRQQYQNAKRKTNRIETHCRSQLRIGFRDKNMNLTFNKIIYLIRFFFVSILLTRFTLPNFTQEETASIAVSKEEFPQWMHWNSENGLQDDWVNYFSLDPFGNVWITQDDVAYCYDGYSFEPYPSPGGYREISQNFDHQIWAEDKKRLLLFTSD